MFDCLAFSKFQGAGNDFVIVDGRPDGVLAGWSEEAIRALARRMCDRHFGVGADGLLIATLPSNEGRSAGATFQMRMLNPDGSESEMCGNGLRCFARWLTDAGELEREGLIETGAGILRVVLQTESVQDDLDGRAAHASQPTDGGQTIFAWMGVPNVDELPLGLTPPVMGEPGVRVSMGNPHAVFFVPDVDAVALETVGPRVERDPLFPQRTNVEFVEVVTPERLRVRVWERGAGPTLACGTGACASLVAARVRGFAAERSQIELPGGTLDVRWAGPGQPVILGGPAVRVFDGTLRLEADAARGRRS